MSPTLDSGVTLANSPKLYSHSGTVPLSSWAIVLSVVLPLGLLLGVIYSGAVVYLPYVKLRGVVTFLYGGLLGGAGVHPSSLA